MKTPGSESIGRSPLRCGLLLILLGFACFGLSPQARAVCREGCSADNKFNTFLGEDALLNNTTGFWNTAVGFNALLNNTNGDFNTAMGRNALLSNTGGYANTAIGNEALSNNTTGISNTAMGLHALGNNTIGLFNTAIGDGAMHLNTTGFSNTAIGLAALISNSTGGTNTAIGTSALENNTTGSSNIAVGFEAGRRCGTGNDNIYIGNIGFNATVNESGTIRIGERPTHGRTFIAGITGATVAGGVGVIVDTNGQLGTVVSSERFKDEVKPMDKASEAILALKPVTFRYKHELDPKGIPQFGLVAEEVAKVNPDLVAPDDKGKPFTVRYEAVNAMLLNEFLKEHREVQELKKQVAAFTAGLQKVSAQLELSKRTSQTVLNNQ
jgi:hypothetical protein